jgi:hypothetical protein
MKYYPIPFDEIAANPELVATAEGGVYLFLRRLAASNAQFPTPKDLTDYVQRLLSTPGGHERRSSFRSHYGEIETSLRFVAALPSDYHPRLDAVSSDLAKRKTLASLLREFPAPPVLYVGETRNFSQRALQHVSGTPSEVWQRLQSAGYQFSDVCFLPIPLPNFDDQERQMVERVLSHVLLAPFTEKAGSGPRYSHQYVSGLKGESEDE